MELAEHHRQRSFFDRVARRYDHSMIGGRINRCHRNKIERIHQWLQVAAGDRVLEVGAGTGIHASWLLELCPVRYTGVDLSEEMLHVAKERLPAEVILKAAAAESLPFEDAVFDAVFCSGALHHFAEKPTAVQEMGRVVRPGGRVVLCEPNPGNPLNLYKSLVESVEHGVRDISPRNFRMWSRLAGLDETHHEFFNFTPPAPIALTRIFNRLDQIGTRLPGIRRIGSMLLFVMEKKEPRR